ILPPPLTLPCHRLPKDATSPINPGGVATPGSTTLTITTSASSAAVAPLGPLSWILAAAALGIVGLCFIPPFTGGTFSRRKRCLALIVVGIALWFIACGGGGSHDGSANTPPGATSTGSPGGTPGGSTTGGPPPTPPPPTPPPSMPPAQSFPITVTATSGTTQATTGVTLTVQ